MDLDDFKATWQAYEQKLDSTQQLSHQLLDIMLRHRSQGTVDKMIREVRLATGILLVIMGFFSAVLAGNPFDYTRSLHFVPAICYLTIAGTGLYFLRQHSHALRQATLHTPDLYHALLALTQLRVQHTKQMGRVWILAMLAGSLIMLPVIARKFAPESWVSALLIVLLPIGITAVSIGLARVAGLFTDHHLSDLRQQVKELAELR